MPPPQKKAFLGPSMIFKSGKGSRQQELRKEQKKANFQPFLRHQNQSSATEQPPCPNKKKTRFQKPHCLDSHN